MKKELILDGLDCADCSLKIELQVKKISGIKNATLNFITKKLVLEFDDNLKYEKIADKVTQTIKNIESDIKILDKKTSSEIDINKKQLTKIIIGLILFAIALILKLPLWANFSLYFISYILVGGPVVLKAVKNISKGKVFDENFLMTIATIGAFLIGEFPEGVAVMLFYQTGEFFQSIAVNRSRKSIKDLMDIRPDYANLLSGNITKKASPEEIKRGDIIIVKPGEKVPLDGVVIEGKSMVDTSALTGEPAPKSVEKGTDILSGFVNISGLLTIEVTKEFEQSTVSKILDLVQNASTKKASTENFITKFARYYTPSVVGISTALAILPPLFISGATFSQWIYRALVFLVISCPCALVISIPLSFFGGIGGASRNGILIKGSNYLEALNNIHTIVFDKTGTLTKGVFNVTDIHPKGEFTKDTLLEYAAIAENYSNHPIALSIKKAYGLEIEKENVESHEEISGQGIKVFAKGIKIYAGNDQLMKSLNIEFKHIDTDSTIVHIAVDGIYAGYIVISDEIKNDSKEAVDTLRNMGIKKIFMLTGDNKNSAEKIGHYLMLDGIFSQLLPHQKVEKLELIEKTKAPNEKLLFVGDGINDAPVLARADVGVAMGALGSDAAIEAADIVLMTDEPSKLVTAIKIAKRTRTIVWQNIIFALTVKLTVLLLGAGGMASMWEAVFADVGVALLAVLNAMRVMKMK
ncbi:UNVERIFIED_CONTAM: Cd2+/Zn2+-exporting ATPase [Acetivibrio alkalicellulosi]